MMEWEALLCVNKVYGNNWNTILTFCNKSCFEERSRIRDRASRQRAKGMGCRILKLCVYKFLKWKYIKNSLPRWFTRGWLQKLFTPYRKEAKKEKFYCRNLKFLHVFSVKAEKQRTKKYLERGPMKPKN